MARVLRCRADYLSQYEQRPGAWTVGDLLGSLVLEQEGPDQFSVGQQGSALLESWFWAPLGPPGLWVG